MIPTILENALGFNIHRVGLLFRRELMRALSDYNLTPEQWQILMTLWTSSKPVNQKEIVKDTLKDKHAVSRIISRLERDGWITKTQGEKDKRVTFIELTEKGNVLKDEIPAKLSSHFKDIWKDFEQDEKQSLRKTLKKLRGVLGD